MDEVGRGTSVQDGLAIAFATIHHLITTNQCRTLFATHFHELADLLGCTEDGRGRGVFDKVRFFQTDVEEMQVRISYAPSIGLADSTALYRMVTSPTLTN